VASYLRDIYRLIKGHGGNFRELAAKLCCNPNEILDMSSNLNPKGPPPGLLEHLKNNLDSITALPDIDSNEICNIFAKQHNISSSMVLAGNGTTQLIYTIPKALKIKKALIIAPTYADYADACIMNGSKYKYLIMEEALNFNPDFTKIEKAVTDCDAVFICNPNNPTGVLIPTLNLKKLCLTFPEKYFIIDESYLPFVSSKTDESLIQYSLPNVIILNSMSKIFRIPGLRTGFLISSENIIKKCLKYFLPWSVNALAQTTVKYLLENNFDINLFLKNTKVFIEKEKKVFTEKFKPKRFKQAKYQNETLLKIYPSTTCFMLIKIINSSLTAEDICQKLAEDKILIRNCANFQGLSNLFIRFSLKSSLENSMLAEKLLLIL